MDKSIKSQRRSGPSPALVTFTVCLHSSNTAQRRVEQPQSGTEHGVHLPALDNMKRNGKSEFYLFQIK